MKDRIKEFRRVPASLLVDAPWNWREHPDTQREAVADSLESLGFYDPLKVVALPDGKYRVIDGHLRKDLIAARVGAETMVPVVVIDFSEAGRDGRSQRGGTCRS